MYHPITFSSIDDIPDLVPIGLWEEGGAQLKLVVRLTDDTSFLAGRFYKSVQKGIPFLVGVFKHPVHGKYQVDASDLMYRKPSIVPERVLESSELTTEEEYVPLIRIAGKHIPHMRSIIYLTPERKMKLADGTVFTPSDGTLFVQRIPELFEVIN
jgi:hypothetical protein